MPVYSLLLHESVELMQLCFINKYAVLIPFAKYRMSYYVTKMSLWTSFISYKYSRYVYGFICIFYIKTHKTSFMVGTEIVYVHAYTVVCKYVQSLQWP